MSSSAQIAANIENAQSSTGPRTDAGKAKSAKNAVTLGLFSGDFIRPGEGQIYAAFHAGLIRQLAPANLLEDILVEEIHRAYWRLRRCGAVESHLALPLGENARYIFDPMESPDEDTERIQKSIDRARSQAHRLLHKCTAELRRMQTERKSQPPEPIAPIPGASPVAPPVPPIETPVAQETQSEPAGTPRNAPCPCGSGQKYKRCCGEGAPAVLQAA